MTAEPDPGTSLEPRGESLPAERVPQRAGAIVSEFVSSIIQEAQAQGASTISSAEEEAARQRRDANDAVGLLHRRVDDLTSELSSLLEVLRREATVLAPDAGAAGAVAHPAPAELDEGFADEGAALDAVKAGLGRTEPVEAEEVEADEVEAREVEPEQVQPEEVEPQPTAPQEGTQPEDDAFARLAELTDVDLARTYTNVVTALGREQQPERAEYLGRLWDAVVDEALRRPTFAERETSEGALGRLSPRRKRRQALFAELRAACRRVGQERAPVGPPPSG